MKLKTILICCLFGLLTFPVRADLPAEPVGKVLTLPVPYSKTWILVHDIAFAHMLEGRMIIIDPLAESLAKQYRGMFNISDVGNFVQSTKRSEMYVSELFYSRGVRGERTDVITIYDMAALKPVDEIVLAGGKRYNGMPERDAFILIDDERLLLVFNMNPATSVTVIDIIERKILNEVDIPGCSLMYPTGKRGFSSLCSNGGILTTQLDAAGKVISQQRVDPFFNVASSPIFAKPAIIDGVAYFPGFKSMIHPVDVRGNIAVPGKTWSLVSEKERQQGWRPGGLSLIDTDMAGNFYILMHPQGREGSQQKGGPEVWVFNPQTKKRLQRIKLKTWGLSLAVTQDEDPLLVVTNRNMKLDIYRVNGGKYIRTISDFGQETPLMLYGVR